MNRMGLKGVVIAALMLVVWVGLALVSSVVGERQQFRDEAVQSIAESYAGPQTFVGPVLVQPYQLVDKALTGPDKKMEVTTATHDGSEVTFPAKLQMTGNITPSERRHGLYRAAVYTTDVQLTGAIDVPASDIPGDVTYGEPYLAFQLTDVRGIVGTPVVRVNGVPMTMTQGGLINGAIEELSPEPRDTGILSSSASRALKFSSATPTHPWQPNLRVRLVGAQRGKAAHYDVEVTMKVAGTQKLSLAPVADSNEITLDSTWPAPLFAGRFLPRSPDVSDRGFHAAWSLSSLAAATQQQIIAGSENLDSMSVSLLTPIDPYKLSDRATKYGILFVVLTFGGFFLFEMMKQLPIHPIQYLLVGFGLAIFFLLLISFSEHMAFVLAYLISSAACIGLLTFYLSYVLRSLTRGLGFGTMLATLYAAVYGLLISEDNALILGSLMLFAVLAIVMVVTRKVDWYRGATVVSPPPQPMQGSGL